MSAFIVPRAHIDTLITAALLCERHPFLWYNPDTRESLRLDWQNVDEIGRMLWQENVASVAYRYDSRPGDELPGPIPTPNPDAYRFRMRRADPVAALKAVNGYEYQTCERPDWRQSDAFHFCRVLTARLITTLPGYDEAAWTIDGPQPVPVIVLDLRDAA